MKHFFLISSTICIPLSVAIALLMLFGYFSTADLYNFDLKYEGDYPTMPDLKCGYVRSKNIQTRQLLNDREYTIFNDHFGARVNNRWTKTQDNITIMTVGGSFSAGQGVPNEQVYTEILARRFNVPVANFSTGGYSGVQSLFMIQKNAFLDPEIIIYGMINDHSRRNIVPCASNFLPCCIRIPFVNFKKDGTAFLDILDPIPQDNNLNLTRKYFDIRANPSFIKKSAFGVEMIYYKYKKKKYLRAHPVTEEKNKIHTFCFEKNE